MLKRPRRLRTTAGIRRLVRETRLDVGDFIYPIFVVEGRDVQREIPSMPGVHHHSIDRLPALVAELTQEGIPGILLFGVPDAKDAEGSGAWRADGIVQRAIREIRRHDAEMVVAADVCLCEYTSHGHCGLVHEGKVDNDATLELLARAAVTLSEAGADIIAPSDMMDGRVGALRTAMDREGFEDRAIMAYSAKYASSFYGPFRDAAGSCPQFGDRKTYQMDYAGRKEAMKEIQLDIEEGADIVMVKPALAYLDILSEAAKRFDVPVAAYNVSGEYCMIKAAAARGWIDERGAAMESLTAIRRAGADIIISYFARDLSKWLRD